MQRSISYAQTKKFEDKCPAELILNYKHRSTYNSLYYQITKNIERNQLDKENSKMSIKGE